MIDTQPAQAPSYPAPVANGLGVTALVFGILSTSVTVLAVLLSLWSITSTDTGWMMVTALLVMPVGGLLSLVLGLVAVILAIVLAARTKRQNRKWIPALVLGLIGVLLIPGFFVAISLFSF